MSDQESINVLNSLVPPLKELNLSENSTQQPETQKCTHAEVNGVQNHTEPPRPSGCPFFNGSVPPKTIRLNSVNKKFPEWQTSISVASEPILYHDYLQLDKILDAQYPVSKKYGNMAHDEHLFIVIHQGLLYLLNFFLQIFF